MLAPLRSVSNLLINNSLSASDLNRTCRWPVTAFSTPTAHAAFTSKKAYASDTAGMRMLSNVFTHSKATTAAIVAADSTNAARRF